MREPLGIRLLAVFFAAGALISLTTAVSLLWPGGPLEPMWRLNSRAHEGFAHLGRWAVVLMVVVCAACATAARGLCRRTPWGRRFAAGVLVVNLVGDASNAIYGNEPYSAVGVPIAAALILYLLRVPMSR
jgi:hypothetical protein